MAAPSSASPAALAKEVVELCTEVKAEPRSRRASQGTVRTHALRELCERAEDRYEDRSIDESLALGMEALALAACLFDTPRRKLSRDRAIRAATAVQQHFQQAGSGSGESLALLAIARLQLTRCRPDMAIRLATEALGKPQQPANKRLEACALCVIIDAHMLKASMVDSGKFVRQSHLLKLTPSEREEELRKMRSRHLEDALKETQAASESFRQAREKRGRADLLCTVADIQLGLGNFDDSKEAAMSARDIFHDLADRDGERIALLLEMNAHIADKDGMEALDVAKEIVKVFRKAKDRSGELDGMLTVMKVHQMMGQTGDVMRMASELRALCKEERNAKMEGQVVDALMQAHMQNGEVDEAISMSQEAMEIYRRASDKSGEAMALHACGCLQLDQFFKSFEENMEEFKRRGCLQQYYKEVDMATYDAALGLIHQAVRLFAGAGDRQGQEMAEETARITDQRAAMLNDPDVTKQVFKDGRVVDVIRTWNPRPAGGGGSPAIRDAAG